jgi:hypothetical protein
VAVAISRLSGFRTTFVTQTLERIVHFGFEHGLKDLANLETADLFEMRLQFCGIALGKMGLVAVRSFHGWCTS